MSTLDLRVTQLRPVVSGDTRGHPRVSYVDIVVCGGFLRCCIFASGNIARSSHLVIGCGFGSEIHVNLLLVLARMVISRR